MDSLLFVIFDELGLSVVCSVLGGMPTPMPQLCRGKSQAAMMNQLFEGGLVEYLVPFLVTLSLVVFGVVCCACWLCARGNRHQGYPGQQRRQMRPFRRPAAATPAALATVDTFTATQDTEADARHAARASGMVTGDANEDADGRLTCVVCVEKMQIGQRLSKIPCGHRFHATCLLTWLARSGTCPYCRFTLIEEGTGSVRGGEDRGGRQTISNGRSSSASRSASSTAQGGSVEGRRIPWTWQQ